MTNAELFELQNEYLKTKDIIVFNRLIEELYTLTSKVLSSYLKRKGIKLTEIRYEEAVQYSVSNLVKQYITRNDFLISISFAGYLQSSLYYFLHNEKAIRAEQERVNEYVKKHKQPIVSAEDEYFQYHCLDTTYQYITDTYEPVQAIRLKNHLAMITDRNKPYQSYMYLVCKDDKEPLLNVLDVLRAELQ